MKKIASIHHLRGIASLGVLLFHAFAFVSGYGNDWIPADLTRIGEAGVDIFFVISGFILTVAVRRAPGRTAFVLGRLARVGGPYWAVVIGIAAMTLAAPTAFRSFTWAPHDLVLSLAFVPSILRDGSIFPLLEPGWTLSLEMLFYLLLAVALGLPARLRSVLICLALVLLAATGWLLDLPQGESLAWFYTQAVLVEFGFGVVIAELYLAGWRADRHQALAALIFGGLGLALAAGDPPDAFERARLWCYGVPAALIVGGALFLEAAGKWRAHAVLSWLGDISYSLYLTHVLVVATTVKLLAGRVGMFGDSGGDVVLLAMALAAAFAAATLFYRAVEQPSLRLASRVQKRRNHPRNNAMLQDGIIRHIQ